LAAVSRAAVLCRYSLNLAYGSVFSAQGFKLHVRDFSLALPADDLLKLRVLGQRVTRLVLRRRTVRHRDLRVDKCHD
jgi:hypothetical protein